MKKQLVFTILAPTASALRFWNYTTPIENQSTDIPPHWTNEPTNGFQSLETDIEFPQNSATDTVHGAQSEGFYRVEVELK